ncbi:MULTISPECIES: hypothetical protein [Acidovorax]|uniref:hypothetical protein n=1 Tax=Acidovorax TaxID=12916 RepID=UPI000A6EE1B6|nr:MULTISPECIES: hypothetical protein [Acidovorax]
METSDAVSAGNLAAVRIYGIVKFEQPLLCLKEVLGTSFPICIGGVQGHFEFPSEPIESGRPADPLREPLVPPKDAKTWRQGDPPILWGLRHAYQYPDGHPEVLRALLWFDTIPDKTAELSTAVYQNFDRWRTRLFDGFDLFSTRWFANSTTVVSPSPGDLNLFVFDQSGKQERPYKKKGTQVAVYEDPAAPDPALTQTQIEKACMLASSDTELSLPYRFQLAAYRAIKEKDFRKAIVETAVASEIALTQAIENRLRLDQLPYTDKILEKFRMLSGRVELARAMGFAVPENIKSALVEPRNMVAHRGESPTQRQAFAAVSATAKILGDNLPPLV